MRRGRTQTRFQDAPGGWYVSWALQGVPEPVEGQSSIVQVAPVSHPMLQLPLGQWRIVQAAPAAHWIPQCPSLQVSMMQVDPLAQ
jgi:hypothetical protein